MQKPRGYPEVGGWPKVCSGPDGNPVGNVQAAQIPGGGGERNTKEKRCSCYAKTNTSKSQQGALGKDNKGRNLATAVSVRQQMQKRTGSVQSGKAMETKFKSTQKQNTFSTHHNPLLTLC